MNKITIIATLLFPFYTKITLAETTTVLMTNKTNVYMNIQDKNPYNVYCMNSKTQPYAIKVSSKNNAVYDYTLLPNITTPVAVDVVDNYASFSTEYGNNGLGSPPVKELIMITLTVNNADPHPSPLYPHQSKYYSRVKNNDLPECKNSQHNR